MTFTLDILNKYPTIKKWLISQLGYYANGMYLFSENNLVATSANKALMVIVAKCHYTESWQSFSSVSKKELQQIIQLKKNNQSNNNAIFQIIENKNIDGFDVKSTTFDSSIIKLIGLNRVIVPETELFINTKSANNVYQVNTKEGILFCGGHGVITMSAYAQGVITDIETYKLTVGLPENAQTIIIEQCDFSHFIVTQLLKQKIDNFIKRILVKPKHWFNLKQLHLLYFAPIITALCFYLLSNSYLYLAIANIESTLNVGSAEVDAVLKIKRHQTKKEALLTTMSQEFDNKEVVHNYWDIIYQLVENNMEIRRISYSKKMLIVRGEAEQASIILADIAKGENIESASFEGPVRKNQKKESFTLLIIPKVGQR